MSTPNPQNPCVFPAHAGMFRRHDGIMLAIPRFPRARGDVPLSGCGIVHSGKFSPRTRGCSAVQNKITVTHEVFPAHAGMFLCRGQLGRLG
mgnify:CR=1 FL=1